MINLSPAQRQLLVAHKGATPTQVSGLRYEARVSRWLEGAYNFHPQIEFEAGSKRFRPDGLLFSPSFDQLCVVEIKNQYDQIAIDQLRRYQIALDQWFGKPTRGVIICQTYRPEIPGDFVFDLDSVLSRPAGNWWIVAIGLHRLPRVRGTRRGLGMDKLAPDFALRPPGGAGDCTGGLLGGVALAARSRAERTRAH